MAKFDPFAATVPTVTEVDSEGETPITYEEVPTSEELPVLVGDADAHLELHHVLSAGGMGVIRSALQRPLRREVAVKTVRRDADADTRQRILDEALVIGQLEHPNIVPIHEVGQDQNGDPVIVMKKIEGVSWAEILVDPAKAPENADKVDLEWHLDVLGKVCDALRFAHSRGVIHCDIKPANVMIGAFGQVFLVDWGVAVYIGKVGLPLPRPGDREAVGTPGFAAPEMASGSSDFDERTDVYLLGATLHEVLTGKPRHEGATVSEALANAQVSKPVEYKGVPEELGAIANRATARDKRDRYQSIDELAAAIDSYREHRGSLEVTAAAKSRLDALERSIRLDRSPAVINDRFIEARFGFRQALEQWPDNEEARVGLRQSLIAMIEYHLARGHDDSAEALIPALQPPLPRLEERLQELRLRKHQAAKELATLKHERDLSIGRHLRFGFAVTMALVWTTSSAIVAWIRWGVDPATLEPHYLASIGRTCGLPLLVLFLFSRLFRSNKANRRIVWGVAGILTTVALARTAAHLADFPVHQTTTFEFFIYGLAAIGIGLQSDRRITFLSPLCFLGGILSALLPAYQMLVLGGLALSGFGYLAWIWRPSGEAGAAMPLPLPLTADMVSDPAAEQFGDAQTTEFVSAPAGAGFDDTEEVTRLRPAVGGGPVEETTAVRMRDDDEAADLP